MVLHEPGQLAGDPASKPPYIISTGEDSPGARALHALGEKIDERVSAGFVSCFVHIYFKIWSLQETESIIVAFNYD